MIPTIDLSYDELIKVVEDWKEQDKRLVYDLRNIRNAIALDGLDKQLAISSLNFWISVYDREHDG